MVAGAPHLVCVKGLAGLFHPLALRIICGYRGDLHHFYQ